MKVEPILEGSLSVTSFCVAVTAEHVAGGAWAGFSVWVTVPIALYKVLNNTSFWSSKTNLTVVGGSLKRHFLFQVGVLSSWSTSVRHVSTFVLVNTFTRLSAVGDQNSESFIPVALFIVMNTSQPACDRTPGARRCRGAVQRTARISKLFRSGNGISTAARASSRAETRAVALLLEVAAWVPPARRAAPGQEPRVFVQQVLRPFTVHTLGLHARRLVQQDGGGEHQAVPQANRACPAPSRV